MDKYRQLRKILGERVKENELLAPYTTFKIGGPADLFYEAKTTDELIRVVCAARQLGVPLLILGGGSNILVGDKGFRGLVVKNATDKISLKGMRGKLVGSKRGSTVFVEVDSGVPFNKLVRFTLEEGLAGLEMHLGLPGTVGGAIYMNSKWTHPEGYVGDVVCEATIITPVGELRTVPQAYFKFGYDSSTIQTTKDVVVSVVFSLQRGDREQLWRIANESIAYRRQSQPQGVSSAGCAFKNISRAQALVASTPNHTTSAGYLVDHAGLKGIQVAEAQISPIHANFIINRGQARASDVLELIEKAKEVVKKQFGVDLEEEIIRVGEF